MDASDATAGWTRTRYCSQLLAIGHADWHRLFSVSSNYFISFREESGETVKKGSATHQVRSHNRHPSAHLEPQ